MGSNPSTAYFHIMVHISLQQAEITGEVLTAWTIQFVDCCSLFGLVD